MPTTTPNSKTAPQGRGRTTARFLVIGFLSGLLGAGCTFPKVKAETFFELTPETARNRALQTRTFETSREMFLLSASAAVLQDLGFQIAESTPDLGILRGVKERGSREYGQEIMQGLIMILGLFAQDVFIIPVDVHQQIAATLATRPVEGDPSSYTVRIVFHRTVWRGEGQAGEDNHIAPGEQWMEMIHDPQIYQQFFAKLSKSVFLEAHQI